jgi:ADP-ribose pyrophosphatase YjhB (NUDIX family)
MDSMQSIHDLLSCGKEPTFFATNEVSMFSGAIEAEIAALTERYGAPQRSLAVLEDDRFDPYVMTDRYGEVCMVIRRPNGRLITMRKEVYPPGVFRLPTGGIRHGEAIHAALLRETAEETGLDVTISRFLCAVGYRGPADPPERIGFASFAFLLDERGGVLASHDPAERLEAFGALAPHELPTLAAHLEQLSATRARAIGGRWQSWGRFRAVIHRAVATALETV